MSWLKAKNLVFLVFCVHCCVHFGHGKQSRVVENFRQSDLLKKFLGYPSTFVEAQHSTTYLKFRPKAACPCDEPRWCEPIQKTYEKEVFIFAIRNYTYHWMNYDWSKITTVVLFGFMDHALVCYAHKNGARAVTLGNFPVANLTNTTQRTTWVQTTVNFVHDNYLDGVNFDIESPIPKTDRARINGLTALVAETYSVLKHMNPHYQVTYDVAWAPDCIDGRCYDIVSLSKVADFLFVMSYDEQSQILGDCMAKANSGFYKTIAGVNRFLDLGIRPEQLVLGVPWYGYDYECISLTKNNVCSIKHVPFRGVNCSDAAGKQINSASIIPRVDTSASGRLWDEKSLSPFFNYKDEKTGIMHQVWYDDPISLKLKYDHANKLGMRGVGMWNSDALDYRDTAIGIEERIAMWAVLPDYGKQ